MDAERRKELLQQLDYGESAPTIEVLRHELRALLARDEALDRVEALPEDWENRYFTPDWDVIASECADDLKESLGRD